MSHTYTIPTSRRPYPEGIAWDEAWHHRQEAERLAQELENLTLMYTHDKKVLSMALHKLYDLGATL